MLPFVFKISIKKHTINFFPKTDGEFPFYLEKEAKPEHAKIEMGIRKTFEKLLNFQKYIKRKSLNDFKMNKLLLEINEFMKDTNAVWTKTAEIGIDDYDFYVFTLVSRTKFIESQRSRRHLPRRHLPTISQLLYQPYHNVKLVSPKPNCLTDSSKKEMTPFFRPWN